MKLRIPVQNRSYAKALEEIGKILAAQRTTALNGLHGLRKRKRKDKPEQSEAKWH
jgi:hypothetical protein